MCAIEKVLRFFRIYGFYWNAAFTPFAPSIVNLHKSLPEQAPVQPTKVPATLGVAVRVTLVPLKILVLHDVTLALQLIPAGSLVTVPNLFLVTLSVNFGVSAKEAETPMGAPPIVSKQESPLDEVQPDQPLV